MKHLVIAGGGFAGVRLARKLKKQTDLRITLINDSEDFRYSPALYRAATGFKLGTARLPLEWMLLDSNNLTLVKGKASKIDHAKKIISLEDGQKFVYDFVVCALGSTTTHFGIDGIAEHSFGVKSPEEILELKQHMHDTVANKSNSQHNYVIIGAGPTGVEVAAALGNYLNSVLLKHKTKYPHVRIYLIEAGPRILPQMSERASKKVEKFLFKLGVTILKDTRVTSETNLLLKTSAGELRTQNVIWTAGTRNNPFFENNPKQFKLDQRGRVVVNGHLEAQDKLYVCGDNCNSRFSGLAITAIGHGNYIAKDLKARMNHRARPTNTDRHPIQVVPIANSAILQYRRLVLSGRLIAFIRHIADLIGYSDVLGPLKAITIWSNIEKTEEVCPSCQVN